MAIHIALLTVLARCAPHTELFVFMVPVARHHRARVPARATGAKPKVPPRHAPPSAPLTLSTTRAPWSLRHAQCVFCDDPDRPLAVGTLPPRVDPQCSASEFNVLCSGPQQPSDAEI